MSFCYQCGVGVNLGNPSMTWERNVTHERSGLCLDCCSGRRLRDDKRQSDTAWLNDELRPVHEASQ